MNSWMFSWRMRQSALTSTAKERMSSSVCAVRAYIQTCPCQYPLLEEGEKCSVTYRKEEKTSIFSYLHTRSPRLLVETTPCTCMSAAGIVHSSQPQRFRSRTKVVEEEKGGERYKWKGEGGRSGCYSALLL